MIRNKLRVVGYLYRISSSWQDYSLQICFLSQSKLSFRYWTMLDGVYDCQLSHRKTCSVVLLSTNRRNIAKTSRWVYIRSDYYWLYCNCYYDIFCYELKINIEYEMICWVKAIRNWINKQNYICLLKKNCYHFWKNPFCVLLFVIYKDWCIYKDYWRLGYE